MPVAPAALNPAADTVTLLDPPGAEDVVSTVARWHDDTHPGPWAYCDLQPCHAVRRANGEGYNARTRELAHDCENHCGHGEVEE